MSVVDWVVVGRFGRPHGIKGFVTIHSFTEPRDNIINYRDWHAVINNQKQPIKILKLEPQSKFLLGLIQGYTERELAARLTNVDIVIDGTQLPTLPEGEYYWHQLVGMQVVNLDSHVFGNVKEVISTGSNDVLVIEGEKKVLIPYMPGQYILNVDLSQGKITVDWGLDF